MPQHGSTASLPQPYVPKHDDLCFPNLTLRCLQLVTIYICKDDKRGKNKKDF